MQADLLDIAGLPELVKNTVNRFGGLDVLVNNASSFFPTPVGDITEKHWDDLVGTNLKVPLFLSQAAAPALRKSGGCIINIVDIHSERPLRSHVLYNAAKAGLAGLTRALADEFAAHNLNVNCVAPGPVNTVRTTPLTFDMKQIPLGRFAEISDVTAMIKLLCSANGRYITGQTIHVNGGFYMNN